MNEQIKKLGRQAMSDVMNGSDPYGDADKMYIPAEFMEKFAELIIQETINVLHDNELHNRHISHSVREHFGV
jgi:hypothetical protein